MKLLLHYLKFDFARWRTLILLLWGLAAFHLALVAGMSRVIEGEGMIPVVLEKVSMIISLVMFGCFGVLCILAGGSDSVIRARTWLMTRPRRGAALFGSRALIIFGGAILPVLLVWWGTLLLMKFNAATMAAEFPAVCVTTLACAAGLALWSLVDPCVSGVIVGAVFTGVGMGLIRLAPGIRLPEWFFRGEIDMLTLSVPVVVAALVGMRGLRTRLTRRSWALNGLSIGTAGVLALVVFIPLQNWFRHREDFDEEFAFRDVKEWRVSNNELKSQHAWADSSTAHLQLTFSAPAEAKGVVWGGFQVRAFSWRRAVDAAWSEWIDSLGGNAFSEDGQWHVSFMVPWESAPEFSHGDVRFGIELTEAVIEKVHAPAGGTALWRGEGWNLEALPPWTEGPLKLTYFTYVTRSTGEEFAHASLGEDWLRRLTHSDGSVRTPHLRLPFVSAKFVSHAGVQLAESGRGVPASANIVNLRAPPVPKERRRIVTISGIALHRPALLVPNKSPSLPEQNDPPQTEPPGPPGGPRWRTPVPWTLVDPPSAPAAEAAEVEVARWLQWVATPAPMPGADSVWVGVDQSRLTALVPQHLSLFLGLAVQQNFLTPPSIRRAIADGTPEEKRVELLHRIPEAPVLAVIARDRGWLDEARPYILKTLLRDAGVPREWEEFVRNYRLPAFAARMEPVSGTKFFRADLSALRTDERQEDGVSGLPDAMELPRRLTSILEKARGEHEPAFHLALQYAEFLYAGEAAALEALLNHLRASRPDAGGWRAELLRQWARQSDHGALPADDAALRSFIGTTTAAGFQFDGAERLWKHLPTPRTP